jgi:two-component system sensor histidine kinase MprB
VRLWFDLSLRSRVGLAAAAAVGAVLVVAAGVVYAAVRSELRGGVDGALRARADKLAPLIAKPDLIAKAPDPTLGAKAEQLLMGSAPSAGGEGAGTYVQIVKPTGKPVSPPVFGVSLPVSADARAVARGTLGPFFADARLGQTRARVYTVPAGPGKAVQVVRSMDEVDATLGGLRWVLLGVVLGGTALAGGLGRLAGGATIAPVRRLTRAVEHVTATRDLRRRVSAPGADELSRLAGGFNAMMGSLEASVAAQRQLVADASHELRTPLTSLRTNVEVLARADALPPEERERLLGDVRSQIEELTALVADMVDLARDGEPPGAAEEVRLDLLVAEGVRRARGHAPGVRFVTDLRPSLVTGTPERLARAAANLLDNAAKWSPPGGQVEVRVRDGELTVRDHGPGISASDLPLVFERFYRAPSARGLPGSGLGLAIVRQVAEAHGGAASAEAAEGGGALMRLRLPALAPASLSNR